MKETIDSVSLQIPQKYFEQVKIFLNLLETGQVDCLSQLMKKDGSCLKLEDLKYSRKNEEAIDQNLNALWEKVISFSHPGTVRALLKHQAKLIVFDSHKAVLKFSSKKLYKLILTTQKNVEEAFICALGKEIEVEFTYDGINNSCLLEQELLEPSKPIAPVLQKNLLTMSQQLALDTLIVFTKGKEQFFRLQGYAGTGKSFLVCKFIKWLDDEKYSYLAATPTNKAAKNLRRIAKNAGLDFEIKTVAQLLGQQPELNETTGKEEFVSNHNDSFAQYHVIIIDEFSMISRDNFEEIVDEANKHGNKVIFVGDPAQLPAINEKEAMVVTSGLITHSAELLEVVRYDGEIARVAEAVRINSSLPKFITAADRTLLCLPQKEWLKRAYKLFNSEEFFSDSDYVRFLAWRNRTVNALNHAVRLHLWGEGANPYVPGDKLIALKPLFRPRPGATGKNKWGIFINNSEEAIVTEEGKLTELKFVKDTYYYWEVTVRSDLGRKEAKLLILHEDSKKFHAERVKYFVRQKLWNYYFDLSRMFDNVGYAYALTVHKAQGSTINNVFLDVKDMMQSPDRQKLLYTALTRTADRACLWQE